MKIPKLQTMVSSMFSNAQILNTIQPDEVISIGCARQASFLVEKQPFDLEQTDIEVTTLSQDIYTTTNESDAKQLLFAKRTTLPAEKQFELLQINSTDGIKLNVHQGDKVDTINYISSDAKAGIDVQAKLPEIEKELTIHFEFRERQ